MTPVGAGAVTAVNVCQVPAGRGRYGRLQRRGAEASPSLQVAGAGLHHHARIMSVCAHAVHDHRVGAIQVDQNIAGVSFPRPVRSEIGQALYAAQSGETDPAAKPLKGFGGRSVFEIVAPYDGNTWRTVYTVRFEDAVYVLHAFQKKFKSGIATPKKEIDLIRKRLAGCGT